MTMEQKTFESAKPAIEFLESLALDKNDFIFRGHTKESYRLETTLKRHTVIQHENWKTDIDEMISAFQSGLARLGQFPLESTDRHDWLEYARHHGVPTPALDFSYSPFVALFFAFDGIRKKYDAKDPVYAVVYALDIGSVASMWASHLHKNGIGGEAWSDTRHEFLYPKSDPFKERFPAGELIFLPSPGLHNQRMHRQHGCLLYDTVGYQYMGMEVLDEFIVRYQEPPEVLPGGGEVRHPTAYRIRISTNCVSDVFAKLELMGINGASLYMSPDGVAKDVINSYNYNTRLANLRGTGFKFSE